jgi:transmembrane sensor
MEEINPVNLITRYVSQEASPLEQEQLHSWLARDEANKKVFAEYLDLWEKKFPNKAEFDLAKGLQRLNYKIDQHEEHKLKSDTSFGWRKIAASVTFLLAASCGVYFFIKHSQWSSENISYTVRTTAPSERTTLTLSDGSVIQLNSNSTFRYPQTFTGLKREVYLTGEAFFEVAKDSLHPFIIHTDDITTQVLGTSFNVNTTNNQIIVSVATGNVKVSRETEIHFLMPEEKIIYSVLTKKMMKSPANLERELAWKNNTIIFDDTQLSEAAKKLEQTFGVKINFDNHALGKCLITGKYTNVSLARILEAISFSTGMLFEIQDKQIILSGKGCE